MPHAECVGNALPCGVRSEGAVRSWESADFDKAMKNKAFYQACNGKVVLFAVWPVVALLYVTCCYCCPGLSS